MAAETQEEAGPDLDWMTAQPYESWAEVRRSECPVMDTRGRRRWARTAPSTRSTSFKDADAVLRDDKTFSSSINGEHIGQFMGDLILALDGDEHRKYRNLVAKAFRASQLERWDDTLVRPIINRLLDAIAPLGRADLVASVTSKYPVQVICGIAGVPLEDAAQFAQWAEEINTGPLAPERGHRPRAGDGRLPPAARRSAARGAHRRLPLRSRALPRSTASASATTRSTASCGCCCPRAARRRSA